MTRLPGFGAIEDGKKFNSMIMKFLSKFVYLLPLAVIFVFSGNYADAQVSPAGAPASEGVVTYSLPCTSLLLEVEAVREVYTPGPYSKYAKKYLGIDVPQEAAEQYQLTSIKLTPFLEADMSKCYVVNLGSLATEATTSFFKMTSQGVIVLSDSPKANSDIWRFPTLTDNFEKDASGATPNFVSTETTLYKNVKNAAGGYDRVSIQQSQVVEKSTEKKAQEIANQIFALRKKRVEIITGDTDATFDGEAMGAAINEISRIESDYMNLFLGKKETAIQKINFNVLPKADNVRQMYVAFRLSPTQGLLSSDNVSGRPIVLELTPEEDLKTIQTITEVSSSKKSFKSDPKAPKVNIYYRVPSVCLIKVLDGQEMLLQTRVPVYQLGQTLSFPIETLIK